MVGKSVKVYTPLLGYAESALCSISSKFESLLETLEIVSDREFMAQLREGIRQADVGETISLEELKAELGF